MKSILFLILVVISFRSEAQHIEYNDSTELYEMDYNSSWALNESIQSKKEEIRILKLKIANLKEQFSYYREIALQRQVQVNALQTYNDHLVSSVRKVEISLKRSDTLLSEANTVINDLNSDLKKEKIKSFLGGGFGIAIGIGIGILVSR